jgi:preprotein translocase subunit YajC
MFLLNLLAETEETPKNSVGTIIIMAVLVVGIIALFVWQSISGKKKQKEAQNMVNSLKIGDRVKTIGGICGFVAQINDAVNTFVLETGLEGNKSFVKFDKGAIYQTAPAQGSANAPKEEPKAEEKVEEVKAEEKTETAE